MECHLDNAPANLVDPEVILDLQALVDELKRDPEVAVVVFDGANIEHFLGPYDMSRGLEWLAYRPPPTDADLVTASKAFFDSAARRSA